MLGFLWLTAGAAFPGYLAWVTTGYPPAAIVSAVCGLLAASNVLSR